LGSDSKSSGPDGTLAFVEVKTRWSKKYGKPEEAVTPRKLARIKRAGELYCLTHPGLPKKLRIDVVAIEVERGRVVSSKLIQVT
ncbi:MAG: YraN family protein, partial [Patescibacteria group bacterium]